jgi:hypothetical protein
VSMHHFMLWRSIEQELPIILFANFANHGVNLQLKQWKGGPAAWQRPIKSVVRCRATSTAATTAKAVEQHGSVIATQKASNKHRQSAVSMHERPA